MRSERQPGLSTERFLVSAYVGRSQNLKNLKDAEAHERCWADGENTGVTRKYGQAPP